MEVQDANQQRGTQANGEMEDWNWLAEATGLD